MAGKNKVKQEGLTILNWVQAKEKFVNERAEAVQSASSTGNLSNDDDSNTPMKWNYNTGMVQAGRAGR